MTAQAMPWEKFSEASSDDVPTESSMPWEKFSDTKEIKSETDLALEGVFSGDTKVSASPYAERLALWDAFSTGAHDTLDGILQFFWNPEPEPIYDSEGNYAGVKTDFTEEERKDRFYKESEIAERHKLLELYKEQYGGEITAAQFAGLVADPSGLILAPLGAAKKGDTILKASAKATPLGAVFGATGYEEEGGSNRLQNATAGMFGAFLLTGAFKKIGDTWGEKIAESYSKNVSDPIWRQADNFKTWLQNNSKTGPIVNKFGDWFIDNYGLPSEYINLKKGQRIEKNKLRGKFNDIFKKTLDLTPEEQQMMYMLATGRANMDIRADLSKITDEGRELIDSLGEDMVRLGMLDRKVYEKNKGRYLHRSYEHTSDPLVKKGIKDGRELHVFGQELMRRGLTKDISTDKLGAFLADGWTKVGNVRSKTGTVRVHRDYTEEELKQMGEITNYGYALLETGRLMTNDVAYFKFLDHISRNDAWASKDEVAGWIQVPKSSNIHGTKVSNWGNLSGMWVRPEIYKDINRSKHIEHFFRGNPVGQAYSNTMSWWKRTKTSMNPVTHVNNTMSNVMLYDIVGGDYKLVAQAGREMFINARTKGDKKSDDLKLAEELGVFNADQASNELNRHIHDVYDQYYRNPILDDGDDATGIVQKLWKHTRSVGNKTKNYLKKTHLDALYQAEDNVFRLGLFKTRIAKGDTPEQAAAFARKYMLDYEISAPAIRIMRQTTHPFIAYMYRAVPVVAESMVDKPWKMAKWGGILYAVNKYGELDADKSQVEYERNILESQEKGARALGVSGLNLLIRNAGPEGDYLDTQHWIPAIGDVFEQGRGHWDIQFVPQVLEPSGGPLGSVITSFAGNDPFTGQKLPGYDTGDAKLMTQAIGENLMKGFLPPWLGGYSWDKLMRGLDPTDHITKQDYTPTQAMFNFLGFKVHTFDERKELRGIKFKYDKAINSYKGLINEEKRKIQSTSFEKAKAISKKKIEEYQRAIGDIYLERGKALQGESVR